MASDSDTENERRKNGASKLLGAAGSKKPRHLGGNRGRGSVQMRGVDDNHNRTSKNHDPDVRFQCL